MTACIYVQIIEVKPKLYTSVNKDMYIGLALTDHVFLWLNKYYMMLIGEVDI